MWCRSFQIIMFASIVGTVGSMAFGYKVLYLQVSLQSLPKTVSKVSHHEIAVHHCKTRNRIWAMLYKVFMGFLIMQYGLGTNPPRSQLVHFGTFKPLGMI